MIIHNIHVNTSIVLKLLKSKDAYSIFEAIDNNREHLRTWLPFVDHTKSVKDSMAFVKSVIDDVEHRQEIFTIWVDNCFAGLIGLKDIDYLNRKIEIGYWLISEMTGKGIIRKSAEKLIEFCFEVLGMNRIQIKCGVGNTKSSAVPKSLGFTFEGIERAGEKHAAKYIDLEVYSILRKEWEN